MINFLERHTDTYRIRVILFLALIRVFTLKQGWVLGIGLEQGTKTKLNLPPHPQARGTFLLRTRIAPSQAQSIRQAVNRGVRTGAFEAPD